MHTFYITIYINDYLIFYFNMIIILEIINIIIYN